jgi:hypothetical protein
MYAHCTLRKSALNGGTLSFATMFVSFSIAGGFCPAGTAEAPS